VLLQPEMMVGLGLSVAISDVASVCKNLHLVAHGAFANYDLVPAIAVLLLQLFQAKPMVATGFLLAAVPLSLLTGRLAPATPRASDAVVAKC